MNSSAWVGSSFKYRRYTWGRGAGREGRHGPACLWGLVVTWGAPHKRGSGLPASLKLLLCTILRTLRQLAPTRTAVSMGMPGWPMNCSMTTGQGDECIQ